MNPKLFRLTIDTNPEDCNASCVMCEEHSEYSDFIEKLYQKTGSRRRRMPKEWLKEIFIQASKLGVEEIIPSTMGEPLIYRYFEEILEYCHEFGIKLNLTTNGTFPKKPVEEWANLICPITSDVKFSWNGATAKTYEEVMRGISFEKVLQNLKVFIRVRNEVYKQSGWYCRVSWQLTFLENNMQELGEMVRLAAKLGVDRVKGHHLWAHFDEIKDLSMKRSRESILRWNNYVDEAIEMANKYPLPNGKKVLLENITRLNPDKEELSIPESYTCPFLDRELWISAEGKISPCCAPDELRQGLGDFGHFPQNTLEAVLSSPDYQELVQNYRQKDVCKTCNMRKP